MTLPRSVQVVSGIIVIVWAGLSLAGSIAVLLMEPIKNWLLTKTVGALLLLGSVWGIAKAVAMLRGPARPHSSLLSPLLMRAFAVAFAALPLVALLLGTTTPLAGTLGLVGYGWFAYTIFRATDAGPREVDDDGDDPP